MAYEYEKENIRKLKSYNVLSGGANITKPIDELKEVYQKARLLDDIVITTKKRLSEQERKAQAWDNYLLCVEEDAKNEFGNNEALIKHAVELNKKIFMEDE
ncbi:hypothetical protein [Staphylococcus pseudoxylosus]|uniref:hypothetical protein n=1 Tax=Staphylococcus pseudoxylosus TaxID=2282419 RepID=UPI002DBE5032|nr:hypothetical protein [Staphylococcus pseudoxylosus]MEB7752548.1 hypothetical protein [Staphylococcus pseudoxylosus]